MTFDRIRKLYGTEVFIDTIERWIPAPHLPGGGYRKDFGGFGDLMVIIPESQTNLIIQSTSYAAESAHVTKLASEPKLLEWLKVLTNRFELWTWKKLANGRWFLRRRPGIIYDGAVVIKQAPTLPRQKAFRF